MSFMNVPVLFVFVQSSHWQAQGLQSGKGPSSADCPPIAPEGLLPARLQYALLCAFVQHKTCHVAKGSDFQCAAEDSGQTSF